MHVSLHLNQYGYTSSCVTTWVHVSLHYKQYWCMCPCIRSNLGHVFLHQKHTGYTRSCFTVWVHVLLDHKQSGYTRSYVTIWAHVLLHLTIWEHMLLPQNNLDNKQIRVPVTLRVKKQSGTHFFALQAVWTHELLLQKEPGSFYLCCQQV